MKNAFSTKWKASVQPRKQRKYSSNAPHHLKQKGLRAPLSKDLRKKEGTRTLGVRTGDKVKILRGQFRGHAGKVDRVDLKQQKIYVEKIEFVKKDGNKVMSPLNPSNVQIIELTDDKRRHKKQETAKRAKEASP